jgi:hypothetical protein
MNQQENLQPSLKLPDIDMRLPEVKQIRKFPIRLYKIVMSHIHRHLEKYGDDYRGQPITYILNFCLGESCFDNHCPPSYSEKRKKETHDEIIRLATM